MNINTSIHDATSISIGPVEKGVSQSGRYAVREVRIETESGTFIVSVFAEDGDPAYIKCSVTEDYGHE